MRSAGISALRMTERLRPLRHRADLAYWNTPHLVWSPPASRSARAGPYRGRSLLAPRWRLPSGALFRTWSVSRKAAEISDCSNVSNFSVKNKVNFVLKLRSAEALLWSSRVLASMLFEMGRRCVSFLDLRACDVPEWDRRIFEMLQQRHIFDFSDYSWPPALVIRRQLLIVSRQRLEQPHVF